MILWWPHAIERRAWRHERHEGRRVLWLRYGHVLLPASADSGLQPMAAVSARKRARSLCALPRQRSIDRKYWGSAGAPRGQRRNSLFFKALPAGCPRGESSVRPGSKVLPPAPGGRHAFVLGPKYTSTRGLGVGCDATDQELVRTRLRSPTRDREPAYSRPGAFRDEDPRRRRSCADPRGPARRLQGTEARRPRCSRRRTRPRTMQVLGEQPDVALILLDLSLPDRDGLDLLAEVRERYPAISVVVLSALADRANVVRALELGALGFIPKSAGARSCRARCSWCFPAASTSRRRSSARPIGADGAVAAKPQHGRDAQASPADLGLTGRQVDVLALMMQGKSNKAICRRARPRRTDGEEPRHRHPEGVEGDQPHRGGLIAAASWAGSVAAAASAATGAQKLTDHGAQAPSDAPACAADGSRGRGRRAGARLVVSPLMRKAGIGRRKRRAAARSPRCRFLPLRQTIIGNDQVRPALVRGEHRPVPRRASRR